MRILIACIHYPVASGRFVASAFKRLGHDARTIGDNPGASIWGIEVASRHIWRSDGGLTTHWEDWTPDLIIVMESAWAYHHPVYSDVPHIVWGVDNHVRNYRQDGIAHYFLAHKAVSVMDWRDDMTWLPCGHDPTIHTPSQIAWADREFDVALVGVIYDKRAEILNAMQKTGLSVTAGMGALGEAYAGVYHNARISLCVSATGDVAQRIFETAAMSCAVLTDELADLDELNLPEGIATYSDADDAVRVARALVNARPDIQSNVKWARDHTWDVRAQVIVDWFKSEYRMENSDDGGHTDTTEHNANDGGETLA